MNAFQNLPPNDLDSITQNSHSNSAVESEFQQKALGSLKRFCETYLSPGSRVTRWINDQYDIAMNLESNIDLDQKPKKKTPILQQVLTLLLFFTTIFSLWFLPSVLKEIDQIKNDLKEQKQVIAIEKKNKEFLDRLEADNNFLQEKIGKVDEALPNQDERAEKIISNLEFIANQNGIALESIAINAVSDSQFYNDDLLGIVQPYQYNFSMQTELSTLLAFMEALRKSLRIMDIMTIDIEKDDKGAFKAGFSLFAYHLIGE